MSTRSLGDQTRGLSRQLPLTLNQELGTVMGNMVIQRRLKGLATPGVRTVGSWDPRISRVSRHHYIMNVVSEHNSQESLSELDTPADITATGSNMIMLDDPGETIHHINAYPFSNDYKPIKGIPILDQCATAWTDSESGKVWILVFIQALFLGEILQNSLIRPNQI